MNEILHANIFFIIASVGVVLLTILVTIILYHVLKMVVALRRLIERIEAGSEAIAADVANVREYVASKGSFVSKMFGFFMGAASRPKRRSRRWQPEDDEEDV